MSPLTVGSLTPKAAFVQVTLPLDGWKAQFAAVALAKIFQGPVSAAVMGVVHWLDAPHLQLLSVGTTAKCLPLFRHVTAQESFPLRDACV